MPALPAVPNVLKCVFRYSSSADTDVVNRFYIQYSGSAPTDAGLTTMATNVMTDWGSDLEGLYHPDVQLTEVALTDLTSSTSAAGLHTGSVAGTRSGTPLPASVALLMNHAISRRYRGGKPRTYFPAGTASDVNTTQDWASAFISAYASAWATFGTAFAGRFPSGTTYSSFVNVSYYEGFTTFLTPSGRYKNLAKLRTGGPVVDDVTAWTFNPIYANQRRRNRP